MNHKNPYHFFKTTINGFNVELNLVLSIDCEAASFKEGIPGNYSLHKLQVCDAEGKPFASIDEFSSWLEKEVGSDLDDEIEAAVREEEENKLYEDADYLYEQMKARKAGL